MYHLQSDLQYIHTMIHTTIHTVSQKWIIEELPPERHHTEFFS